MSTRNLVGPIPEPQELYGRDDLIDYLWKQIAGCNILLLAPRRFGKSGVMRHVLLKPRDGYLPLDFELEDVQSPEEFVWRVTAKLLKHDKLRGVLSKARDLPSAVGDWVRDNFDEVGFEGAKVKFKEAIKEDWAKEATRLMLEMEKAEPAIIFIFDEFPTMIENLTAKCGAEVAVEFLGWFRKMRLEHKDKLRRHRFLVAGSIGIDTVLRTLGVPDKFNDFHRIFVEPLAEPDARQLTRDLAETHEIAWNDSLDTELFSLLGVHVPYFIHLLFSQLGQLPRARRQALTPEELRPIYQERVLGPTCKDYFQHYSSRLRRLGKAGERAAVAMLRSVAGAPAGRLSRSALFDLYRRTRGRGATDLEFDTLLGDLEHDWYLVLDPNTNEYHFMVKVMQDWWRRWYPPSSGSPSSTGTSL